MRNIPFLEVIYSPSLMNKAHAHIQGIPPNKPREPFNQMRKNLKRIFNSWDICPELIDGE